MADPYANISDQPIQRSGLKTEADGEFSMFRKAACARWPWTEITVAVFDENDDPVETATGIVTGKARKAGQGKPQDFTESIDLAADNWAWKPERSTVEEFLFSISGLNANYSYEISIIGTDD